jgi:putative oxygen-independent coproporphyrinogen III oxidase
MITHQGTTVRKLNELLLRGALAFGNAAASCSCQIPRIRYKVDQAATPIKASSCRFCQGYFQNMLEFRMEKILPLKNETRPALAVYIHWPFCRSKCPYCDFNSHVAAGIDHAAFRAAYRRELEYYAARLPGRRVTSVFFGGGTPSLMEEATVVQVLSDIARLWVLDDDIEITLEANPNSAEARKFASFRKAGVNRLSLGVQALRNEDLRFLGRGHDVDEARAAIDLARQNFPRFSFDLIYARRGQSLPAWEQELHEALALADGHLSLYQLTIEPGTQFGTRAARGETLTAPDENAASMYELTQDILAEAGSPAYEVSNHARPGAESRHNLAYWHYDDYLGIGPGAHGRFRLEAGEGIPDTRLATEAHRAPDVWLRHVGEQGHGLRVCEELNLETAMREAVMMGLRLTRGISIESWQRKFGAPLPDFIAPEKTARLQKEGYLANDASALKATAAGMQRLNAVLGYLMA